MASNRIRGITIEIDGNVTPLTDALKKADKALKDTQSQLNDVNRLLKLDPSNVTLLTQKQKLLKSAVEDTKKRQEELKKALEQSKKAGDTAENRKQQNALQRELIETTEKLKDLEKQYNACSPRLEALSAKTGQAAEATKGLSTAAGVAAAGMITMAVKAGQNADALLTDARMTGFTVEELQKLKYAQDIVDVSYETMIGSVQKLTKNMSEENSALQTLGISIYDENGNMRDAVDVWYEAIEALGQVENGTERDKLSMDLFGKSAMEMAGIVDDGGAKLKALGEEAETAGLIMSGDAVQGASEFNDSLDKLKATAMQSFAQAGATLATTLIPMLEKLVTWVSKALTWFGNLDGTTQKVILTILGLVAGLSPVLSLISKISGALPILKAAFAALSGPVGIVIAAIAALVAIGITLYKNWDTIKAKAIELWGNLTATWEAIKGAIVNKATEIWGKVTTTFNNIKEAIMKPIRDAVDWIKGIVEKIKDFFNFKIQLPHIPLPHFGIQPPGWKIGDLLHGSIPRLGIEWYAKAMDNGMILDSPTIFGAQNGQLLAGGERGAEVVVGAKSLMSMIREATGRTGGVQVSVVINGNVDDYDALAETIGQKLQQQMARSAQVWA
jgi:phage-related minor tail protein